MSGDEEAPPARLLQGPASSSSGGGARSSSAAPVAAVAPVSPAAGFLCPAYKQAHHLPAFSTQLPAAPPHAVGQIGICCRLMDDRR